MVVFAQLDSKSKKMPPSTLTGLRHLQLTVPMAADPFTEPLDLSVLAACFEQAVIIIHHAIHDDDGMTTVVVKR